MSLVDLTKDTYLMRGSPATLIRIIDNVACVIDPGSSSERGLEIKRLLDKKGISRVLALITHHHTDHIYALTTLKPSEVYLPRGEELLVTSKSFRVFLDYGLDLTAIDKTAGSIIAPGIELNNLLSVKDGEEVCGFKAIDLKGHSPGQLGYSLNNELLYVGDALFGDKVLSRVKIPYLNDYSDYVNSLYKLMELYSRVEYKYIIMGHGPLVNSKSDLAKLIDLNIRYLEDVEKHVVASLKEPRTLDQLTSIIIQRLSIEESPISYLLTNTSLRAVVNHLAQSRRINVYIEKGQLFLESIE